MKNLLGVRIGSLNWLERGWLLAPVVIWFSYQPLIRLGQDSTTYYELSLLTIYLFLLALVGMPNIWHAWHCLIRDKAVWLVSTFVGLSLLTLLWTPNLTRGVLTAGLIGVLYVIFLAALVERDRLKKLLPVLSQLLVVSALGVSILAFIQVIMGIWFPRETTLLCAGCLADQFGFVRPNVFAIEPQFLGSLLIAPLLILLNNFFSGKRSRGALVAFVVMCSALFLTLSRGAIYAFALGALFLFILNFRKWKQISEALVALLAAFLITLVAQGTAAALNPRVEITFYEAVSSSLNQLSLGVISLPAEQSMASQTSESEPAFDGYVKESTDTRLSLSGLAVGTWVSSPFRVLAGVGLGGSGIAIHNQYPNQIDAREIIQNEYAELLLEYGLVGLGLFLAMLGGFLYGTRQHKWAWAFLLAYMVQWLFFSGYPNALHVYLVLIALYVGLRTSEKPSVRRA